MDDLSFSDVDTMVFMETRFSTDDENVVTWLEKFGGINFDASLELFIISKFS